jgi:hypothetical protein
MALVRVGRSVQPISGPTEMHLLIGHCLIVGCQACSGPRDFRMKPGARGLWERHKDRLLALWRGSGGERLSGFSAAALAGSGASGALPCWAEITYEGRTLPRLVKAWPEGTRAAWAELRDNLRP